MNRQKTALISVYNKEGITEFAKELVDLGWKIISSGGTAKHLAQASIPVTDIADITEMPPILDHRVVTLHPRIHGGLLALDTPAHLAELEKYGIPWIDLVCVDLYPLEEEINNPNATRESVIEKTDMGGVALIRSSAKGRRITIYKPEQRVKVIDWLKAGEPNKDKFLNDLAAEADFYVAKYSATSAQYHGGSEYQSIFGEQILETAYGENPYQKPAGFFVSRHDDALGLPNWKQLEGSPMSYNNLCDLDRMLQTVTHIAAGFDKNFSSVPKIVIGVKHGNACGVGMDETGIEAIDKMLQGDLRAIFGGSVMLNFPVDEKVAEELINKFSPEGVRRLLDIVAAPSFTEGAIEILARKKGKCRLLANPAIEKAGLKSLDIEKRFRYVRGGFLTQPNYTFLPSIASAKEGVPENTARDVILAWAIGSTSNSNTITLVKDGQLLGNGVGQQDRVGAAKLAIFRAEESFRETEKTLAALPSLRGLRHGLDFSLFLSGATAYSDSFFPFPDAPQVLIDRGIKTIFSTSGSVNDEKIKELCKSKGVNLIMLPDKDARGFYMH